MSQRMKNKTDLIYNRNGVNFGKFITSMHEINFVNRYVNSISNVALKGKYLEILEVKQ